MAVLTAFILFAPAANAFVDALMEGGLESSRRNAAAESYRMVIEEKMEAFRHVDDILLENPSLEDSATREILNMFIRLLEPLYVTAIILTGIYLLFISGSPEGRSKAKSTFLFLVIGMGLISVSSYILLLLFSLSHSITGNILGHSPGAVERPFVHAAGYMAAFSLDMIGDDDSVGTGASGKGVEMQGVSFLFITYILLEAALLALKFRYFVVAVLAAVFPLAIMLYSFAPGRRIGGLILEQTTLWTLSQAFMALFLGIVVLGVDVAGSVATVPITEEFIFLMEITGLLMLALVPLVVAFSFGSFFPVRGVK